MKNEKVKMNIPFTKPKTLHELLKQGSGHNLVLDFSLLSKRGGLIEKAKKYQNLNNQKITETLNTDKTKISKNFEILSKLGKKKTKIENKITAPNKEINIINSNIEEELINDLDNKINLTKIENDRDNNNNVSQDILELEYDNNFKNSKLNQVKYNPNIEIKEENNLYEEEPQIEAQILNNSSYTTSEQSHKNKEYNLNKNIITKNRINIQRPFVISKSPNRENTNTSKKIQAKKYYQNQVIEYETIKELYTIKHCNCVIEYSFREDQNIDSEILMEDKSKSIENFNNDKSQMVFEIFDGHGGDEMSTFLQTNLANIYKQNLLLNKGNIILSLKNAFHDADDEMKGQLNIEGLGSTGTLVHLVRSNEDELEVYSANVGDSRVSLISPEHIIRLSYDHRTTDEKEKKRILESGMEIIDDRICGTLMLTRIFGNYEYKEDINENEEKNDNIINKGLICEPFISKINIDLYIENQYLILASDGVWDILTEEEIQKIIIKYKDTEKICSIIIKKCIENEAWDNLSVFAVKLT